jgi:hypothetical protein
MTKGPHPQTPRRPNSDQFQGESSTFQKAWCYPRSLQDRLPIMVGGGKRRTLRLAARYADAANVFGDATTVRRKAEALGVVEGSTMSELRWGSLSTANIGVAKVITMSSAQTRAARGGRRPGLNQSQLTVPA